MAFGQAAGVPAHARQIDELAELLARAGFESFREARHPYGLNQRQAAGRFTVDEADELLERLRAAEVVAGESDASTPSTEAQERVPTRAATRSAPTASSGARRRPTTLKQLDAGVLAAELERRGWCCIPPTDAP